MAYHRGTRIIAAPIDRVFEYRLDVRNLPAYNPDVADVQTIRGQTGEPGTVYAFRLRLAPGMWTRARLTVGAVERPSRLEFRIASLMNAREVCRFVPVEMHGKTGTEMSFDYTVHTRGGLLAPLLDAIFVVPAIRRHVEREMERIAARLEARHDPAVP